MQIDAPSDQMSSFLSVAPSFHDFFQLFNLLFKILTSFYLFLNIDTCLQLIFKQKNSINFLRKLNKE